MSFGFDAIYPQGQPFRPFTQDLSGFGQSNQGMASLLQMGIQAMTGKTGMAMMGVNDRNLFDRLEQQRVTDQHFQMVRNAARNDSAAIQALVKGGVETFGGTYGPAQARFAGTLSSAWASPFGAPIGAMMAPNLFDDAMAGKGGSEAVMTHFAEMATRRRIDPITGRIGMSMESGGALIHETFKGMYGGTNYLSAPQLAGRTGQMWNELQTLGMMPGTRSMAEYNFRGQDGQYRPLADMTPSERDRVMQSPQVKQELAAHDSSRVINTLKDWGKAVNAMKDIFGDAGVTDAPMPVLINALRQLTSGGFTQMNAGEIGHMARTMRNLSKGSGISMESASMLIQGAAGQAQKLGIESVFAPQATMEGLAFAQAWGMTGRGSVSGWDQPDVNQLMQARVSLYQSGVASPMANRMGLMMRLRQQTPGAFRTGTEADAYFQAISTGQTSFSFNGQSRDVNLQDSDFVRMMAAGSGGVFGEGDVQRELLNAHSNRESLYRNPGAMTSLMRRQAQEYKDDIINPIASQAVQTRLTTQMGGKPVSAQLATSIGSAMSDAMMSIKPELLGTGREVERNKAIGDAGRARLQALVRQGGAVGQEAANALANLTDAEMTSIGGSVWADASSAVFEESGGRETLNMRIHLGSEEMIRRTEQAKSVAGAQARYQSALDNVGVGGPLRRLAEALSKPEGKTLAELATTAFGGVRGRAITDAIRRGGKDGKGFDVSGLEKAHEKYQDLRIKWEDAVNRGDDKAAATLQGDMDKAQVDYMDVGTKFKTFIDNQKLSFDTSGDLHSLKDASHEITALRKVMATRGVTDDDKKIHSATIHELVKSIKDDPMRRMGLGKEGEANLKELEEIQGKIDAGEFNSKQLQRQQDILADLEKRAEKDGEKKEDGSLKEIRVMRLIMEDVDLGSGVFRTPDADTEE